MENKAIQTRVDECLALFDKIKARTGDERSALTILQEVNKDVRMAQIRAERENGHHSDENRGASSKQLAYLKRLGVEIPANLTSKQASALIDNALGKESE